MKISEIEFKGRKIDVYFDNSEVSIDKCAIIWQARNPESLYIWTDEDVVYITKNSEPANSLPKNIFESLIKKI